MRGARWQVVVGALAVLGSGCRDTGAKDPAPSGPVVLSQAECDRLLTIETADLAVDSVDGPDEIQVVEDLADPSSADLSQYSLTLAITQTFENTSMHAMTIEGASATVTDAGTGEMFQSSYVMQAPLTLQPGELQTITFLLVIPADQVSGDYLFALLEGAEDMTVAPIVHIDIPGTDNCGHSDGIDVRGSSGVVRVQRPREPSIIEDIVWIFLKSLHG